MFRNTFIYIVFSLIVLAGTSTLLHAKNPRWVETHSWESSGHHSTPLFKVNAEKWRLVFRRSSSNRFLRVSVYDSDHEKIHTVVNRNAPFFGYKQLNGKGKYYLQVEGEGINWEISIKQLLNRMEEWDLMHYQRDKKTRRNLLASWHGEGEKSYSFDVPEGGWRLNYETKKEGGKLVIAVDRKEGERDKDAFERREFSLSDKSSGYEWINFAGEFDLQVQEATAPWHISVEYYRPEGR